MSSPNTVKVVIIGASGCGKTSLRGQYISGRYSTGYRATIGADFIAKSVPNQTKPDEFVTLQIWDTAGQERFSSLSSAFFRGADAAILVFDVNKPETLDALLKWWAEFRDRAPLADEDLHGYCCVVVGNKMDVTESSAERVTEASARQMLNKLVPPLYSEADDPMLYQRPMSATQPPLAPVPILTPPTSAPSRARATSHSIAIYPATSPNHASSSPKERFGKSRSRSSSRFYGGTMTTTHTTLTIYHTPSSSLFDVYASARTSPEPWETSTSSPGHESSFSAAIRSTPPRRMKSLSSASSKSSSSTSAATITPNTFARNANASSEVSLLTSPSQESTLPPRPIQGPALFFTSARTGAGVSDVFEYVANRVSGRWNWEHEIEARRMSMRESPSDILRLGLESSDRGRTKMRAGGINSGFSRCC